MRSDKSTDTKTDTIQQGVYLKPELVSDPTNTLTGKTENVELDYIVWGCACANWITPADFAQYQDHQLAAHCIFIEPASDSLRVPIYFDPAKHRVKVKGQFYIRADYPRGMVQTEEQIEKVKVFRYTQIEVIGKPDFVPSTKNNLQENKK
jgi:hypothetical protein